MTLGCGLAALLNAAGHVQATEGLVRALGDLCIGRQGGMVAAVLSIDQMER
jgi:hypothetical protein